MEYTEPKNGNHLTGTDVFLRKAFFFFKPVFPRPFQIYLRRRYVSNRRNIYSDVWPIDRKANIPPPGWRGWPEGKQFALVLTHDVESEKGQEKCRFLSDLEEKHGFRSLFNFVAEQYKVDRQYHSYLRQKGFEIGLHGITHKGNPFRSRKVFDEQAGRINRYLKEWNVSGFRCPSMYHNLEWIGELDVEYDLSTFDTDPFEPQPDGMRTIFPFWVPAQSGKKGYVELPYTIPQDHAIFVLQKEENIHIWKNKLDWIAEHGGMALLNTHPDYMNFNGGNPKLDEYPVRFYEEFLGYLLDRYRGRYWHVVPGDMARFWRENYAKPEIPISVSRQSDVLPNHRDPKFETRSNAPDFVAEA